MRSHCSQSRQRQVLPPVLLHRHCILSALIPSAHLYVSQIFTFSATADASARAQEAASIGGATATIATMPRDERLAALRAEMAAAAGGAGVQAYIIPSEDPHMSEYAPDCYKRREFISRHACCRARPPRALKADGLRFNDAFGSCAALLPLIAEVSQCSAIRAYGCVLLMDVASRHFLHLSVRLRFTTHDVAVLMHFAGCCTPQVHRLCRHRCCDALCCLPVDRRPLLPAGRAGAGAGVDAHAGGVAGRARGAFHCLLCWQADVRQLLILLYCTVVGNISIACSAD